MRSACTPLDRFGDAVVPSISSSRGTTLGIPEIGHDKPESAVTINQNGRSRSAGTSGHDPPESPVTTNRNDRSRSTGIPIQSDHHFIDPIDSELHRFDEYMQQAKGLAESTRHRRLTIARALICNAVSTTPSADELRHFIAQEISRVSPASAGALATALRGYLRFRAFEGDRVEHLLPVIASPACWRLAPLPLTLSRTEVERLLDAFPPDLPSRLRSYAIVRCLVDLGLRSREVISLDLDDIDWVSGTLHIVKCKSRRVDVMPLPQATGSAIAAYLRSERPKTINRRVFVRHVAPVDEPVGPDVVRRAVREAYQRCGLPYTRVHILRHTLASRLLNTGGTLKEVADVLRHRELNTSQIYAKVDIGRLSAVAMPWPGSAT